MTVVYRLRPVWLQVGIWKFAALRASTEAAYSLPSVRSRAKLRPDWHLSGRDYAWMNGRGGSGSIGSRRAKGRALRRA